jgi:hypothetical protein
MYKRFGSCYYEEEKMFASTAWGFRKYDFSYVVQVPTDTSHGQYECGVDSLLAVQFFEPCVQIAAYILEPEAGKLGLQLRGAAQ